MKAVVNLNEDYYVEKLGEGVPIIFLPAGGFSGHEGLNIAEYFSKQFETHMIDLPGFGKSKGIADKITPLKLANWLNDYLQLQNLNKVNLIGHSLGGAISLAFATHYPEKVNRLVLLDQGHKPFPRIPKSDFGLFAFAFPLLNIGVNLFGLSLLNKLGPLFVQSSEQERDFERDVKHFCEQANVEDSIYVRKALKQQVPFSVEGLNLMFGYYNLSLTSMLKKLRVSTFLIYGTFESVNEKEHHKMNRYIKKLENDNLPIIYYPIKGGHYVHWDDEFPVQELRDFLTNTYD